MTDPSPDLSRRSFLKFAAVNLAGLAVPRRCRPWFATTKTWPHLAQSTLPGGVREILALAPAAEVRADGILTVSGARGRAQQAPLLPTQWNQENSQPCDRLTANVPWAIVLHWYGDRSGFDHTLKGYLRGFDSLRRMDDEEGRTSAHFLVGAAQPEEASPASELKGTKVALLQTQAPAADGVPFVASHLRPLDYLAHKNKRQYFVRALYQLGYGDSGVHSILQDWYDSPKVLDPNCRSIAIEVCGSDFENEPHIPCPQQTANVLALVWALMKRYQVRALDLLGHQEIQLNKPDPGKKYLALVRYLIGVKALAEADPRMNQLVFGPFLEADGDLEAAVRRYFRFVRDFFVMVGTPRRVYEWESASAYWQTLDLLPGDSSLAVAAGGWTWPVNDPVSGQRFSYLDPENHEGLDLYAYEPHRVYRPPASTPVLLAAAGRCIYIGETAGCRLGQTAIFRHRQADGAELLSIYGHLTCLDGLRVGQLYRAGHALGAVEAARYASDPFLHFAIAYGATWDTDLSRQASIPLNAGTTWIGDRYVDPENFLMQAPEISPATQEEHDKNQFSPEKPALVERR